MWRAGLKMDEAFIYKPGALSTILLEHSEEDFYNYKGSYSITFCILLALKDADCKFVYKGVGINGIVNDGKCIPDSG